MRKLEAVALVVCAVVSSGCFHVTVETGLPAGTQSIRQPWAMSFIYGLIPPPVVSTAAQCPDGVSRVETQHSFLNGLVAALTFSLVTPMTIDVQCAARRAPELEENSVIRPSDYGVVRVFR